MLPNDLIAGSVESVSQSEMCLKHLIGLNPPFLKALELVRDLPSAWVGAGIVFQNIWNIHHGYPLNTHLKDIDILYFDPDLSYEAEDALIKKMESNWEGEIPLDIKNTARIHLWYPSRFGIQIAPYQSVLEAVSTWPVLGACLMVRKNEEGNLEFCAPYGFGDAFAMRVRPNKLLVSQDIYEKKAQEWLSKWPQLTIFDW